MHPFVLQTSFRYEAQSRLKSNEGFDSVAEILYRSVLDFASLIDANVLCYLWPKEFDGYVVCIISGSLNNPIFSVFRPRRNYSETLIEVLMHCDHDHFTLLKPVTARNTTFKVTRFHSGV